MKFDMQLLSRRHFLQSVPLAGALRGRGRSPNLVFIIADEHSGLCLGHAGHPVVRTPRLDALAQQGVTFTHACTAGIICVPSRSSLDTGLHVHTHGARTNGVSMRAGLPSIFSVLGEHGYLAPKSHTATGGTGKKYQQWAESLGYGRFASSIIGPTDKARLIPTPYRFEVGRAGVAAEHSLDAFAIQNAIRFLEEKKDRPFGLWVQLHGAHDPFVVPAPFDTMYRPSDLPMPPYRQGEYETKPARQKRTWQAQGADKLSDGQIRVILAHYLGMVSFTDHLVGQFLDKLSALGLDGNTVVVYMADHGDTMGYHRMFTKGFAFYEPSLRVPLIIRAPNDLRRAARVDALVSGVDVLPTLLELMGLPPVRGVHGRSLVPLWRGRENKAHDRIFAGQDYEGLDRLVMLRTPQWKLTRYDEGGQELYDLEKDPHELRNLIDESKYAAVAAKLSGDLKEWDYAYPHAELQITPQMEQADPQGVQRIRQAFAAWRKRTSARVIA